MTVFAPTAAAESGPTSAQPVPLHVAKDNCAKRAHIPIENKRNFLDLSADIMEHVARRAGEVDVREMNEDELLRHTSSPAPFFRSHSFRSRKSGITLSTSFQNASVWSRWWKWQSSWTTT